VSQFDSDFFLLIPFFIVWISVFVAGIVRSFNPAKKTKTGISRVKQLQVKNNSKANKSVFDQELSVRQTSESHYSATDPCSESLEYNSAQAANRLYKDPWEIKSKYKND